MMDGVTLKDKLKSIDGQDYGRYQSLKGEYDFPFFKLIIHQIPKDPYAPSHTGIYRIKINRRDNRFISFNIQSRIQNIAFRDFLTRRFYRISQETAKSKRGTGYSGVITINQPGQVILDRNCMIVDEETIEIRCFMGLPAQGRKIDAKIGESMLLNELPEIIEKALFVDRFSSEELIRHIQTAEDSEHLRNELESLGLIGFIMDGSILPRKSGISDLPMGKESAQTFKTPPALKMEIVLPNAGKVTGMGISEGITLIVGGGYHGKSTLLNALETGCYNHIPDDGREGCASISQTIKIRAYSGRYIEKVDISPFISNLPYQKDTTRFSASNASGSTSQAASIMEAIEMGAKVLLMDEDTCATNFMIRDSKMQQLVNKDDEPITSFIDSVKKLYTEEQISTVLVLGGIGDYFDVSDKVIQMIKYEPLDVTLKAKEIARKTPIKRSSEKNHNHFKVRERIPLAESVNPYNDYGKKGIYAKELCRLSFGNHIIDLIDLEQLIEISQTKALGYAMDYAKRYMEEHTPLDTVIARVMNDIKVHGLDILSDRITGHFAEFRPFELAFALNRLRSFKVKQKKD